jgi:hypothetical protein
VRLAVGNQLVVRVRVGDLGRTGWPAKPEKVTSKTSTVARPESYGWKAAGDAALRASSSVAFQKSSKSAGSSRSGRYSRSC